MSSPSRSVSRASKVSSTSGSGTSGRRNSRMSRRRKSKSEKKSLHPDEDDYTDTFDFKVRCQNSGVNHF